MRQRGATPPRSNHFAHAQQKRPDVTWASIRAGGSLCVSRLARCAAPLYAPLVVQSVALVATVRQHSEVAGTQAAELSSPSQRWWAASRLRLGHGDRFRGQGRVWHNSHCTDRAIRDGRRTEKASNPQQTLFWRPQPNCTHCRRCTHRRRLPSRGCVSPCPRTPVLQDRVPSC